MFRRYLERKVARERDGLRRPPPELEAPPRDVPRGAEGARERGSGHVLVDEYQDVNRLQAEIVDLLASDSEPKNVMVVGDDAQSIYSFRGADFRDPPRLPGPLPRERTIFRLETNYRSTPEILALANASIAHNARRYQKTLVADARRGRPGAVVGAAGPGPAGRVRRRSASSSCATRGRPSPRSRVLYRAHYQALELQIELTRRGIPYEIRSGLRFFEQAHVKDVLAFLRLLVNPKDEMSLKRALKLLPKVGERTAAVLWEAVSESPEPLAAFLALELREGAARGARRRSCASARR